MKYVNASVLIYADKQLKKGKEDFTTVLNRTKSTAVPPLMDMDCSSKQK